MRFRLVVDGAEHLVEVQPGDPMTITVDGTRHELTATPPEGEQDQTWHIEHGDGTTHTVIPGRTSQLDGVEHRVEAHGMALAALAGGAGGLGPITPPMPGRVLKVLVQEGDSVALGDPLVVLEAMKMQNTIEAPADGVVQEVHVRAGEAVEAGEALVTLGAPE